MDYRKLTTGGAIVAAAGILFFLDSLIPWHRECFQLFTQKTCVSENAWGTPFSTLASLLALILVAEVIAVQMFNQKLPPVAQFTWPQIRLAVAGATVVLVVLQFIVGDHGVGRSFGMFIGIILAAGLLYGTYLRSSEAEPATTL